jgi:predicted kinase
MIIQIMGLPGSGKTELARELADRMGAIVFNADEVRGGIK